MTWYKYPMQMNIYRYRITSWIYSNFFWFIFNRVFSTCIETRLNSNIITKIISRNDAPNIIFFYSQELKPDIFNQEWRGFNHSIQLDWLNLYSPNIHSTNPSSLSKDGSIFTFVFIFLLFIYWIVSLFNHFSTN